MTVLIAAGGTGGHIYPGLALADAIKRIEPAREVAFVGTRRGLEQRLIPEAGYPLHFVNMVPFAGRSKFFLPAALLLSVVQARSLLAKSNAAVAVGMGGYAGVPLVIAARSSGVPALIHESGAVPGKANLVAARFVPRVALSFESSARWFKRAREVRTVGMPLRKEIEDFDREGIRAEARSAFGVGPQTLMLLVVGGSQGAATLNAAAVELAARWRTRSDVMILIKAGAGQAEAVQEQLQIGGGSRVAQVVEFIDRMDHAYAAADLALCRAGAGTVAELSVVGLPAILVPYPHAPSDHQTLNARVLSDVGGGIIIPDSQATGEALGPLIEEMLDDRTKLDAMRLHLAKVARPDAADELARWALSLARR